MTDGPTLSSVPCAQTSTCLRPRARPSVWYSVNHDLSEKIQCYQWQMSPKRWRLAHWRRWRRCIEVSLGHRVSLRKWYLAARRHQVMMHTDGWRPVRRISWALNLGVERNLLTCIILRKYSSCEFHLKYGVALSELCKIQTRRSFQPMESSKSNPISPLRWPTTLTSDESAHVKIHEMYSQGNSLPTCIQTTSRNWSYMFQINYS